MKILGPTLAGLLSGLLGAVVWIVVSHYLNYEVGWIALGIGAIVGVCVRTVAGGGGSRGLAVIAFVALAISIYVKYVAPQ